MKLKKRQIRILLLVMLSIFIYTSWVTYSQARSLNNDDFIRFHVIANSNTERDQALKLKVRDAVLAEINQNLAEQVASGKENGNGSEVLNLEMSKGYLEDNIPAIEKTAEKVIRENGYTYTAKAKLGVRWIPAKTYGDITFPAGNYEALNVVIGEGKGENWWCVLYPPLCLIGAEPPEDDGAALSAYESSQELYKDIVMDKKYDSITKNKKGPTTLKLKFKTAEILEKEFNKK